jgi:hypothetical protein
MNMNDRFRPHNQPPGTAVWLAVAAIALLVLSNLAWLLAYGALAQRVYATQSPSPTPALTPSPTATATPLPGQIYGSVGFPAGTAPAQTVCAVSVSDSANTHCIDHPAGNSLGYTLSVPAGTYYVYASLKAPQGDFTTSYKAYYNEYVTCFNSTQGCAPGLHNKYVPVTIASGGSVSGINPTDWYALGVGQ